jgi:hypothetical protein
VRDRSPRLPTINSDSEVVDPEARSVSITWKWATSTDRPVEVRAIVPTRSMTTVKVTTTRRVAIAIMLNNRYRPSPSEGERQGTGQWGRYGVVQ